MLGDPVSTSLDQVSTSLDQVNIKFQLDHHRSLPITAVEEHVYDDIITTLGLTIQ